MTCSPLGGGSSGSAQNDYGTISMSEETHLWLPPNYYSTRAIAKGTTQSKNLGDRETAAIEEDKDESSDQRLLRVGGFHTCCTLSG